jgi:D-alanine-D-alanine ligase
MSKIFSEIIIIIGFIMTRLTDNDSNTTPIVVGILFGGQSAEHDVSLKSTQALVANLDRTRFSPKLIYISRQDGLWRGIDEAQFEAGQFHSTPGYSFLPWLNDHCDSLDADIYFPMLHGPNGEDGKIQALLEMANKPFVGANYVASALAMDKVAAKVMFEKAGLRVGPYLYFIRNDADSIQRAISEGFGFPVFIKPCAMGSSVGITKVDKESELKKALDLAFRYDSKIIVEKALDIREIEVSVMGNNDIMVSQPGELIPHNEFYDYEDKYLDGKTTFHMPAHLSPGKTVEIREIAGKAFQALFLNGMSRVDLFIEKNTEQIYVNEINTIPGFTQISMFPKLWSLNDINFSQLITRLIDYGFDYHRHHKVDVNRG